MPERPVGSHGALSRTVAAGAVGTAGGAVAGGVDLGGTGSRFVVVSGGHLLAQSGMPTAQLGAGGQADRTRRMARALRRLVPDGHRLARVGIGASGPVTMPDGVVRNWATLPQFSGFDLVGELAAELGAPVAIDNDAVAAALGEYHYGAGRGCGRLLAVTLGTGIGAAFLVDGQPFRDRFGQHPECGHLPVLPGGERCYCGLTGCWETTACRSALESGFKQAAGISDLSTAYARLEEGDADLEAVAIEYGHALGRGLELLNVAYSPERVVLCGSVSRFLPYFAKGMRAEFERSPGFGGELEVVGSELGDLAGAIGACVLGQPMEAGGAN
ncbi:MAG TPA: ROK family protein [Acidimicrobiales bacterium]|nr:ROK family protein [Acidimicrobiales bacterium]